MSQSNPISGLLAADAKPEDLTPWLEAAESYARASEPTAAREILLGILLVDSTHARALDLLWETLEASDGGSRAATAHPPDGLESLTAEIHRQLRLGRISEASWLVDAASACFSSDELSDLQQLVRWAEVQSEPPEAPQEPGRGTQVETPEVQPPEAGSLDVETSESEVRGDETPGVEVLEAEAPKAEAPKAEAPKAEALRALDYDAFQALLAAGRVKAAMSWLEEEEERGAVVPTTCWLEVERQRDTAHQAREKARRSIARGDATGAEEALGAAKELDKEAPGIALLESQLVDLKAAAQAGDRAASTARAEPAEVVGTAEASEVPGEVAARGPVVLSPQADLLGDLGAVTTREVSAGTSPQRRRVSRKRSVSPVDLEAASPLPSREVDSRPVVGRPDGSSSATSGLDQPVTKDQPVRKGNRWLFVLFPLFLFTLGFAILLEIERSPTEPPDLARTRIPFSNPVGVGCAVGDEACAADEPPTELALEPFSIATTETSWADFQRCIKAGVCRPLGQVPPDEEPRYPVTLVSWDDARNFCRWVGGRLPSEAEWEVSARLGRPDPARALPAGANHGSQICCSEDDGDGWRAVGPVDVVGIDDLGLWGMAGNVQEWTASIYDPEVIDADPVEPGADDLIVVRGGSWIQPPEMLRVSARHALLRELQLPTLGFRCAWSETPGS